MVVMMKWWDRLRLSFRRIFIRAGRRLRRRRRNGLRRLKRDVNECKYEDVHVMWEILESRSRRARPTRQRHRRVLRLFINWASSQCGHLRKACINVPCHTRSL